MVTGEHNCGDPGEYIKRVSVCERLRSKTVGEVKVSFTLGGVGKGIPKERDVYRRREVCE